MPVLSRRPAPGAHPALQAQTEVSDEELATLRRVRERDFEVVKMGEAATR
ncbi:MAG TPA: hypothetical protein VF615_06425 [Longimicrobiaceae bacterium]